MSTKTDQTDAGQSPLPISGFNIETAEIGGHGGNARLETVLKLWNTNNEMVFSKTVREIIKQSDSHQSLVAALKEARQHVLGNLYSVKIQSSTREESTRYAENHPLLKKIDAALSAAQGGEK